MALRDWENWMWLQAESLLSEAERIRWGFLESASKVRSDPLFGHPSWGPAVNLIETDESLWIVADLAGVDPQGIKLGIGEGCLVISARRTVPPELQRGRPHIYEIPSGPCERKIRLPEGCTYELGEKSFCQGLLTIELRKIR
jgi:HSP20 family molecular chaperone IbpA